MFYKDKRDYMKEKPSIKLLTINTIKTVNKLKKEGDKKKFFEF